MANEEQPQRGTQPYEDEPLLRIVRVRILQQEAMFVEEDCLGFLERDAVFPLIRPSLLGIPGEA